MWLLDETNLGSSMKTGARLILLKSQDEEGWRPQNKSHGRVLDTQKSDVCCMANAHQSPVLFCLLLFLVHVLPTGSVLAGPAFCRAIGACVFHCCCPLGPLQTHSSLGLQTHGGIVSLALCSCLASGSSQVHYFVSFSFCTSLPLFSELT